VYKLHGLPAAIVSDRDPVFTSRFWQQFFMLSGTSLQMSSSYHPQTDGEMERNNQCLETFLRCFVHSSPKKWKQWLSAVEFWYNMNFHLALGRSPFEALFGHQHRLLGIPSQPATVGNLED
jgi:transposase InsO family protein